MTRDPTREDVQAATKSEEHAVARYVGRHFGIGSEVLASADVLLGGLDPAEEGALAPGALPSAAGGLFG